MKRQSVRIVRIRMMDAAVGDVVNRKPESEKGWFEVVSVDTLFDGQRQLTDSTAQVSIAGWDFDLVGLQVAEQIEVGSQRPSPEPAEPDEPETESETELEPELEEPGESPPPESGTVATPAVFLPEPEVEPEVGSVSSAAPEPGSEPAPAAEPKRAMFVAQADPAPDPVAETQPVAEPQLAVEPRPAEPKLASESFPGSDKSPVMAPGAGPSLPTRR